MQDILPTTAHHVVVAVSEFGRHLRVKDIQGAENWSATVSLTSKTQIGVQ